MEWTIENIYKALIENPLLLEIAKLYLELTPASQEKFMHWFTSEREISQKQERGGATA